MYLYMFRYVYTTVSFIMIVISFHLNRWVKGKMYLLVPWSIKRLFTLLRTTFSLCLIWESKALVGQHITICCGMIPNFHLINCKY